MIKHSTTELKPHNLHVCVSKHGMCQVAFAHCTEESTEPKEVNLMQYNLVIVKGLIWAHPS